ncbi:MAG: hypothetical protein ACE37F_16875 [Nannocystaceae bacterium]|nr:hypothetical protein [bacterium]
MLTSSRTRALSFALLAASLGACDDSAGGPSEEDPSTTGTGSAPDSASSTTGQAGATTTSTTSGQSEGESSSSTGQPSSDTDDGSSSSSGLPTGSESSDGSSSSSTGEGTPDVDTVCEAGKRGAVCELPSEYDAAGECDPYAQNCAEGEKCVPWAADGGSAWNSTRCSPVPADPDLLGDPCQVEGSGVSGVDSCDVGLMCWDVDAETNTGTCIELCGCGPVDPTCDGGGTLCTISNDGVLPMCLPTCDPLDPSAVCDDGDGCYPVSGNFQCAPDASGDGGLPAQSCDFINDCDPGLACASPDVVPGCDGIGCCTPFCDLDEPETCPFGSCQAWFEAGDEPLECHVDTGICALD